MTTAHVDTFANDHLPPPDQQPEYLFTLPELQFPERLNCATALLDSHVADMRNIGGPMVGTITASIFLSEFTGDIPWAHIDMAGVMKADGDEGWLAKGATGYGARLLIDLVTNFQPLA